MAQFEAFYGRQYILPIGWYEVAEISLIEINFVIDSMGKVRVKRERLKASKVIKCDIRRKDHELEEGDLEKGVIHFGKKDRLSLWYLGPYKILYQIEKVTFELYFPVALAMVHLIFYMSMLKKFLGDRNSIIPIEGVSIEESLTYEEITIEILDH